MFEFAFACLLGAMIWGAILGSAVSGWQENRIMVLVSGLVVPWIVYAIAVANGVGKGDGPLQGAMAFMYLFAALMMLWIGRSFRAIAEHTAPQHKAALLPTR